MFGTEILYVESNIQPVETEQPQIINQTQPQVVQPIEQLTPNVENDIIKEKEVVEDGRGSNGYTSQYENGYGNEDALVEVPKEYEEKYFSKVKKIADKVGATFECATDFSIDGEIDETVDCIIVGNRIISKFNAPISSIAEDIGHRIRQFNENGKKPLSKWTKMN